MASQRSKQSAGAGSNIFVQSDRENGELNFELAELPKSTFKGVDTGRKTVSQIGQGRNPDFLSISQTKLFNDSVNASRDAIGATSKLLSQPASTGPLSKERVKSEQSLVGALKMVLM